MDDLLLRLKLLGINLNDPAVDEDLQLLTSVLDCRLPEAIDQLYRDHNGELMTDIRLAFRLMSVEETVAFHTYVQKYGWSTRGIRIFWTDDNSNYAGIYVEGNLAPRICFIAHEEIDLSPVYRTTQSFLAAILASPGEEYYDLMTDYPEIVPAADYSLSEHDWAVTQTLKPLFEMAEDEQDREYYAFCIMALTPYQYTDSLVAFTYDPDMYVQERACEVLGLRKYEPAASRLFDVAMSGMPNGRIAAILALDRIGPASRPYLEKLAKILPKGYSIYVERALKNAT